MAFAKPVITSKESSPTPIIFKNIDNYLSKVNSHQQRFVLCIKGVQSHLDSTSLKNILSKYGNVTEVNAPRSESCSYYFAECPSQNDFEAILKGMQNNEFKIRVEPKSERRNQENDQHNKSIESINRSEDVMVKRTQNNQRNFHNHNNRNDNNQHISKDINHHCRGTGHRRNSENDSRMNNKENAELSEGVYNSKRNSNEISLSQLKSGPCSKCKKASSKICERCDAFYCSIECQTQDWETHRFYCFKMPKLITIKNDEKNKITDNINFSNREKNLSINELKNKQKNMPSNDLNHGKLQTLKPSETDVVQKLNNRNNYNKTENTRNDNRHCKMNGKMNNEITDNINISNTERNLSINELKNMSSNELNHGNLQTFKPNETGAVPKLNQSSNNRNNNNKTENTRNDNRYGKMNEKNNNERNGKIVHQNTASLSPQIKSQAPQNKLPVPLSVNKPKSAEVPKSGQIVIMTHFEQPNMVYIRSNIKSDNNDYIEIINKVNKCSVNANSLTELPNVDEYVVGMYEDVWFRAIVLKNENPEQILVRYVDYGNKEYKKLSELKELLPECFNLKIYPVLVYLKNINNVNNDFINYMKNFVENGSQLKFIYKSNDLHDNIIMAELYDLERNENINNKSIELFTSVMFEDIKEVPLPAGENISIVVLGHSMIENGFIYCISSNEFKVLEILNKEVQEYAESNYHHFSPRKGEMCIAKSENGSWCWYRAYCYEVVSDEDPTLFFPDYGFILKVPIKNIREYPKTFTLPIKTDECLIAGLEFLMESDNINPELEKRLRQLIPLNNIIWVPKVEYEDGNSDAVTIHLPNVIDILRQEGLLEH